MKIILVVILLFSSTISYAKQNYNKAYIRALLIENAIKSDYVSPSLALAVAQVESNFRADVVSHKGAVGVMQIMPRTALLEFGVKRSKLFNPQVNIRIGVEFLDRLIKKYKGDVGIALSHYNGGSAVGRWPNVKIIPATYSYVIKVLQNSQNIKQKIPLLSSNKNKIIKKANYKLDRKVIVSETDLLVNNIDKWLNIYNNYQKKKISIGKNNLLFYPKKSSFQGNGTNSYAFF